MTALALSGVGVIPASLAGIRTITGLTAMITVVVPDASTALGVEDELAQGMIPLSISDNGTWDAVSRKVKWFFNVPGQIRDRVLQYTVDRTGLVVSGVINFGSGKHPIAGCTAFTGGTNPGLLHPADDNGDWRVVLDEAAACVTRWKSGVDDYRTPVVVRGITLYLRGEHYSYDPTVTSEAQRWIPMINSDSASFGLLTAQKASLAAVSLADAVRTVQATNVTIAVTPEAGTSAWGLDESVSEGIQVTGISNDGTWDAIQRKIKWIFLDGVARTLSYSFTGQAGTILAVTGSASFDGSENSVSGTSVVAVPLPFQTWVKQRGLSGTQAKVFNAMNAEYGQPNGLVYAFQSTLQSGDQLLTVQWVNGQPVIETPKQDASTLPYVDVSLIGTTELEDADWSFNLVPAADQSNVPVNRCRWAVPLGAPDHAFFKIRAVLK